MRVTFDVRINQRPAYFFAFEFPETIQSPDLQTIEELSGIERTLRQWLPEELERADLSVEQIAARWGSLDIILGLAKVVAPATPIAWDTAVYLSPRVQDTLVDLAIGGGALALWRRFRDRGHVRLSTQLAAPQPAGDLLATARRIAAYEASITGCSAQLLSIPEIQKGGYKAEFALSGDGCSAATLAVTVRYDGKGYQVRRS